MSRYAWKLRHSIFAPRTAGLMAILAATIFLAAPGGSAAAGSCGPGQQNVEMGNCGECQDLSPHFFACGCCLVEDGTYQCLYCAIT